MERSWLSSRTTDDDDCSGQSKVSQASRKLALAKSLSRWRPRHALPTQVQQPRQEPGGSDSDMYGPGSSGWRWTWTGGTIWVRLSSALALAAAPQTRTYVRMRPTLRRMGDGGCRRDFWGAQTSKAGSSLSRWILKGYPGCRKGRRDLGFGQTPCLPHLAGHCRFPPLQPHSRLQNMAGQTTSVQHLTRPSAKQYFLLTSGKRLYPRPFRMQVSALRRDALLLLRPVCQSACPVLPPTQPRSPSGAKTTVLNKKTAPPLLPPRLNPFRVLAAPIPSASLTQRANHPETHRPSIPPSVLASASNNYNRRTPSFLYLVYGAAKHVSCTTSLIAPSLPVLLLCRL